MNIVRRRVPSTQIRQAVNTNFAMKKVDLEGETSSKSKVRS